MGTHAYKIKWNAQMSGPKRRISQPSGSTVFLTHRSRGGNLQSWRSMHYIVSDHFVHREIHVHIMKSAYLQLFSVTTEYKLISF